MERTALVGVAQVICWHLAFARGVVWLLLLPCACLESKVTESFIGSRQLQFWFTLSRWCSGYSIKRVLLPVVVMEASFGAERSQPCVCWQSETAKKLHNQVGYAFRRARRLGMKAPCWENGALLAGQVTHWAKSLDLQLAAGPQVVETAQGPAKPRQLMAHLSDETCIPHDEIASSCATTEA